MTYNCNRCGCLDIPSFNVKCPGCGAPANERKYTQSEMESYGKAYADARDKRRGILAQEAQAVPREGRGYATKDAIERAKRVMAAVDTYHARPDGGNRHALRSILMDEFEELLAAPQSVPAQCAHEFVPYYEGVQLCEKCKATQSVPAQPVVEAMQAYLRQCRCGGMPSEVSDQIERAVKQASHLGYFAAPPAAEQDVPRALTDEDILSAIASACAFDRAGVERWRSEALIVARAVLTAAGAK